MACYLKANKSKMVRLLRDKGYHPTVKRSLFEKTFRERSYWLTWLESNSMYLAHLMTAGGRPYLRIANKTVGGEKMIQITPDELKKYDIKEEIRK